MNIIYYSFYKSPIGELIIGDYKNQLCLCDWRFRKMRSSIYDKIRKRLNAEFVEEESEIISTTKFQLLNYFEGVQTTFSLPLLMTGSDFQLKVWKELMNIPHGKTESYLSLARKLNNEKAIRAVASANGANCIAIIIPCHRIIGSNGELTGYAGGLRTKQKLLELESKTCLQMNLFN